jgi:misacylated tRNA(Ala) deacylase
MDAASVLSCGAPLVPQRVEQVTQERKRAEKRVGDLERELARLIAADLLHTFKSDAQIFSDKPLTKHLHRTDDSENALAFLSAISFAFGEALQQAGQPAPYLLLLSSSVSSQSSSSITVLLVTGSDATAVKAIGDALKTKMSAKGGGQGQKWSGKVTGVWKESHNELVATIIKDVL